jgi:hypothetical protein
MSKDEINKIETAAYRKAFEIYMRELVASVGADDLKNHLANSTHVHTTILSDGQDGTMVCITEIHFSDQDEIIQKALETYQGDMGKA